MELKLDIINLLNNCTDIDEFKINIKNEISDITINETDKLLLIANKYKVNSFNITKLEKECKIIIINKETKQLVVYLYDSILFNDDATHYLLNNNIKKDYTKKIYKAYEGTSIILHYFDNKWNICTRKCLDSQKSAWNNKTYYKLFNEAIEKYDNFYDNLNTNYYYVFLLMHHQNKNIIDYSFMFGENYKKLFHIMTKSNETHLEIADNSENIFKNNMVIDKPEELDNYDYINNENNKDKISLPIKDIGIIIKLTNKINNNIILLKLNTCGYKIINKLKPNYNNNLKTYIDLYKQGLLKEHLIYFPGNKNIILKDNNIDKEYDIIGIIDSIFKVITSELFELFKLLYDLKDCSHKNKNLYDKLPNEYKIILYKIRGLYFEKKEKLSALKSNTNTNTNIDKNIYKKFNLKIKDIYNLLKIYEPNDFFKLILNRTNLFNADKIINVISNRCDINILNMCNLYIKNM
jgi:hypothetical protein